MILAYEARVVGRLAQSSMGLLPIVPILLLPFILIFFVVVFPIWGVALGVIGLVLLVMRGLQWLANRAGVHALDGAADGVYRAFRWVLTFGGFTERMKQRAQRPSL
ncbi:MAG TPA: hypothetical protein VHV78_05210 [Gemmatimonadaceae bacterium]|jgi:hypothetical protein|nr:hypothetical protein [Gemmatimonadaceae bacterium]